MVPEVLAVSAEVDLPVAVLVAVASVEVAPVEVGKVDKFSRF
ncbi:unknown [[Mannheimia] succiniciproducens MBEL55E]|uniref:Uncharacterized protein n=1 Tax=Mannheimia succiniciproducens (strain KCTC 0769BP / MBEL55E) TaxID=221988 RepID=Q65T89_MANSM|nr:unknown [[Mannheimia] succiniciproducens MBEL55E]